MKTARKQRDFSIEGILADTFICLHNDHYKNTLQSTITQNSQVKFLKRNNCMTYPESIFDTGIGSDFKSVKNNFEFTKRNLTVNGNGNIEIAAEDMNVEGELDRSDESHTIKIIGRENEVHINNAARYNKDIAKFQGNINRSDGISNDNGKRNNDTAITYQRMREDGSKNVYTNCTKLCLENQYYLNEIIVSDVLKDKKEEVTIHDKKLRCEQIFANCSNIDIDKHQMHVKNVQETKQLETIKENQSRDADLRHKLCKVFEEKETDLLLINNLQGDSTKICKDKSNRHQVIQNTKKLEWLNYTRYKPPKVSRKSIAANSKRKRSIHPRIPFTTFQLELLEQKFRKCAYLSRDDVSKISDMLRLPTHRVKIWFQNRRAREKRTNE